MGAAGAAAAVTQGGGGAGAGAGEKGAVTAHLHSGAHDVQC